MSHFEILFWEFGSGSLGKEELLKNEIILETKNKIKARSQIPIYLIF